MKIVKQHAASTVLVSKYVAYVSDLYSITYNTAVYIKMNTSVSEFGFNDPPTNRLYRDRDLSLKPHPKDWRKAESTPCPLIWYEFVQYLP